MIDVRCPMKEIKVSGVRNKRLNVRGDQISAFDILTPI